MKGNKVKNIIKAAVGIVFMGGVIFLLDFLGICDISSIFRFHKKEKEMKKTEKTENSAEE